MKSKNVFVMFRGMFKAIIEEHLELGWWGDPINAEGPQSIMKLYEVLQSIAK
jgi:hypothetical protein